MVITGMNGKSLADQLDDIHTSMSEGSNDQSIINDGRNEKDQTSKQESEQQPSDYFTFKYRDGSIDFNDSMNFDSKKFIGDVIKTLANIKNQAEAHKFKLFICQAFKIPMDDLVVNQSDEKFSQTVEGYVSKFDTDKLNADIGSNGIDDDGFLEDDNQSDGFDEGI